MFDSQNSTLEVVQGLRTFAEQDRCLLKVAPLRQRVSQCSGGQSNHNYGLAVDSAFLNGQPRWEFDEGFQ